MKKIVAGEFIYCPQCGSGNLWDPDYDDDDENGIDSVGCDDCSWEGDTQELVCAPEKGAK
jgi:uncharacterized protein (DUF983 family)